MYLLKLSSFTYAFLPQVVGDTRKVTVNNWSATIGFLPGEGTTCTEDMGTCPAKTNERGKERKILLCLESLVWYFVHYSKTNRKTLNCFKMECGVICVFAFQQNSLAVIWKTNGGNRCMERRWEAMSKFRKNWWYPEVKTLW